MKFKLLIVTLASLCIITTLCLAKDIEIINKKGQFVEDYLSLIKTDNLKDGDKIFVTENKFFIFNKWLGEGNTTRIFEVTNPADNKIYALRLPINSREYTLTEGISHINHSIKGYHQLNNSGVNIPRFHEYIELRYILLDKIDNTTGKAFDLGTFLANYDSIPTKELKEAEEALYKFTDDIAQFKKIGDFHDKQIIYNIKLKKWILLDWTDKHLRADNINSTTVINASTFQKYFFNFNDDMETEKDASLRAKQIYKTIIERTKKKREAIFNAENSFWRKKTTKFKKSVTAQDFITFYTSKPKINTDNLRRKQFKHFIANKSLLTDITLSIDDLLKLKKHLVVDVNDFTKFIKACIDQVNSLHDLEQLVHSHGNIKNELYPEQFKKIRSVATNKLKQIMQNGTLNNTSKKTLEKITMSMLFKRKKRDKLTKMIAKNIYYEECLINMAQP